VTPEEFIARWRGNTRTERAAAQHHFLDLCELLGVDKPGTPDYEFEKSTRKIGDTQGFADVWRDRRFIWEYKGDRKNLVQAYAQLKQYADAFGNPPLLIVSDMQEIRVHTNFTNSIAQQHVIPLAELRSVEARDLLRNCFLHPERLQPDATRESVTAQAAAGFAKIALLLRQHYDERRVAHFINKLVFCLFAEDIDLLPDRVFADLLDEAAKNPDACEGMLRQLFAAMANPRGTFGPKPIPWFNGGLFDDDDVLPLNVVALADLAAAARLDWKAIDPTIFGTLFESGLDDKKRAEMASLFDAPEPGSGQKRLFDAPAADRGVGIHYTDEATIMKIIDPVVMAPLRREWDELKGQIRELDARRDKANSPAVREQLVEAARTLYRDFRERLGKYRVLDPACGSGNFLALSLRHLKNFDLEVLDDGRALGLPSDEFRVGPEAVLGIEINPYAAELARLTVWITELQWQLSKGHDFHRRPILDRLDGIQRADALLTPGDKEREWPEVDVIVGNPPFVTGGDQRAELGDRYTEALRQVYFGRVPGRADLVVYWLRKAAEKVASGSIQRFGLVATKAITKGVSRTVLQYLQDNGRLVFDAWTNELWVLKGAAVRVSLVCAANPSEIWKHPLRLNGYEAERINSDLTSGIDITVARRLTENLRVAFQGLKLTGPFDLLGNEARDLLSRPLNPNGQQNSDVVARLYDIHDVVGRPSDRWVVDFGCHLTATDAALYEGPFRIVVERVIPFRDDPQKCRSKEPRLKTKFWEFQRPCPELRRILAGKEIYIVTPESSEHRLFCLAPSGVLIQGSIFAIARDDFTTLGILSSKFHEAWSTAQGNRLGVGNQRRYNIGVTFETFPFPEGLTPNIPAVEYKNDPRAIKIFAAARELDRLRNNWLNPPDLIRIEPEIVPGYPDRILPKDAAADKILKTRTLTNLYNERPTWLANAHRDLDAAVATAYCWPADISEENALLRLRALNLERAAAGR
jgi:methylase of polypeptide subunit release factors